jgi:DNA-directed RNA polymerase specialized sigma24 family protein
MYQLVVAPAAPFHVHVPAGHSRFSNSSNSSLANRFLLSLMTASSMKGRTTQLAPTAPAGSPGAGWARTASVASQGGAVARSETRSVDSVDVQQSVWCNVFTHEVPPEVFESEERFLGYIIRAARNHTLEVNRKYLGVRKRSLDRQVPLETDLPENLPGPHQIAEWRDCKNQVLSKLEPWERQAWELLIEQGLTYGEVAQKVNVPPRWLAALVKRVRREMCDETPEPEPGAGSDPRGG